MAGRRFTGAEQELEVSCSYVMSLDRLAASVYGNRDTQGHLPAEDDEETEHEGTFGAAPLTKSKTRARGRGRKA